MALDYMAKVFGVKINKNKFKSLYNKVKIGKNDVILLKPQTYMNASGEAVSECMQFYKIPAENLLVIFDDISLDVGTLRIRRNGSSGGHNGVKSIIEQTGEETFIRIKIGVGEKPNKHYDLSKWVLAKFSEEEKKLMQEGFKKTTAALKLILNGEIEKLSIN